MSIVVPFAAASVSAARNDVRDWLGARRLGSEVVDAATIVVSELLGNAVRHATPLTEGTLAVTTAFLGEDLQISVTDGGGGEGPRKVDASPWATGGRGIAIVETLANEWWCESTDSRRTVHAILPLTFGSSDSNWAGCR